MLGPTATVSDLSTSRRQVGSPLTTVNLSGLTRVELGFALALTTGAAGLVLAETLPERRRSHAIVRALGARRRQVTAFIRVESTFVTSLGVALGALIGWGLAELLVKILKGVFDPPPTHLFAPWSYLILVGCLTLAAAAGASVLTSRATRRPIVETIRHL